MQYVYQPLTFKRDADGTIRIINRDSFTDPSEYDITCDTVTYGSECLINIYARLKEDKPWAEKGFVVAREQFVLQPYKFPSLPVKKPVGKAKVTINGNTLSSWIVDGREVLQGPLEPYFWKPENDVTPKTSNVVVLSISISTSISTVWVVSIPGVSAPCPNTPPMAINPTTMPSS